MTDRDSFVMAICSNPADNLPRLVYADWLGENGEPKRGEFIRVQCELASLDRERTALFNDDVDWKRCDDESGISASWCPNCGDCSCPDREERMDDRNCPLHSPDSNHCRLDVIARKEDGLRRLERDLLKSKGHKWLPEFYDVCWNADDVKLAGSGRIFRCNLVRGFIDSITLAAADWLAHADELY